MSLQALMQQGRLWRGQQHNFHQSRNTELGLSSGHSELDHVLPFAGWPRGALTEILHPHPGQGELQLLLPALARLTQAQQYIVLIDPPWLPYAPALHAAHIQLKYCISIDGLDDSDRHWALEQTLRAGQCGAALAWPRRNPDNRTLRRLQLAAEAGDACAFLFRSPRVRQQPSPAALRLQLHWSAQALQIEVIKCRGRHADGRRIELSPKQLSRMSNPGCVPHESEISTDGKPAAERAPRNPTRPGHQAHQAHQARQPRQSYPAVTPQPPQTTANSTANSHTPCAQPAPHIRRSA